MYSETVSSDAVDTKSYNVPHQHSQDSFVKRRTPDMESVYSKIWDLRPSHWSQYMPPTPPIPHEYYASSPETPSCLHSTDSTTSFNPEKLCYEVPRRKRRVQFSDSIKVRILFGGIGDEEREIVVDTQLVDVFRFDRVFGFGPIRVVVVALPASGCRVLVFPLHRCSK